MPLGVLRDAGGWRRPSCRRVVASSYQRDAPTRVRGRAKTRTLNDGSFKPFGVLVPWKRDDSHNSRAGHPVWPRRSSLTYAQYARSSRLASRAPRSGIHAANHAAGTLGVVLSKVSCESSIQAEERASGHEMCIGSRCPARRHVPERRVGREESCKTGARLPVSRPRNPLDPID